MTRSISDRIDSGPQPARSRKSPRSLVLREDGGAEQHHAPAPELTEAEALKALAMHLEAAAALARRIAEQRATPPATAVAQVHEEAPAPTRDEFLDANALASLLGLDARSVRRIHLDGRMPSAVRIGSALRWRKSDIDEWLANGGGER